MVGFIVIEPVPTAEPRRLNTSLLRLLNVECTFGELNSLGLNWNRRYMYIRNGMNRLVCAFDAAMFVFLSTRSIS